MAYHFRCCDAPQDNLVPRTPQSLPGGSGLPVRTCIPAVKVPITLGLIHGVEKA